MYRIACQQDEKTILYFDKCGNKHIRRGGNLSWRINNPGLVKSHSHFARSNGSIGSCKGFAIFSYPEQGHKTLAAWLHSKKYYNATVQAMMGGHDGGQACKSASCDGGQACKSASWACVMGVRPASLQVGN